MGGAARDCDHRKRDEYESEECIDDESDQHGEGRTHAGVGLFPWEDRPGDGDGESCDRGQVECGRGQAVGAFALWFKKCDYRQGCCGGCDECGDRCPNIRCVCWVPVLDHHEAGPGYKDGKRAEQESE